MLIKTKFKIIIAISVLIVILVASIEYVEHRRGMKEQHLHRSVTLLAQEIYDINFLTYEYIEAMSPDGARQWQSQYQKLQDHFADIRASVLIEKDIINKIEFDLESLGNLFLKLVENNRAVDPDQEKTRKETNAGITRQLLANAKSLHQYSAQITNIFYDSLSEAQTLRSWWVISTFVLFTSTLLLLQLFLGESVFPVLEELKNAFQKVANGRLDYRINSPSKDELGEICRSFDLTVTRLADITVSRQELDLEIKAKELSQIALKQISAAMDQSKDAVLMYNSEDQTIFYANQGAEILLGYNKREFLEKKITDLVERPLDRTTDQQLFLSSSPDEKHPTTEIIFRHKNGSAFFMESSNQTVTDTGSHDFCIIIARDISKRKAAEKELLQQKVALEQEVIKRTQELQIKVNESEMLNMAMVNLLEDLKENEKELNLAAKELADSNKELESFTFSVSHDLRAPLRHMTGFVNLLQKHAMGRFDDDINRYLEIIKNASIKMGLLIDDLLHYSRTGRAEMLKVVVDTETLVRDVVDELTEYEPERHITWQIEPLPDVYADQSLLRIVWMNILGNAMKFTGKEESPLISIGSLPDDKGEAIYFVKDNGAGFNMKYCAKAFGVFQRLHSENEFKGTGIGLATVQKIIQRHGGNVWAEAEVGRGAVFYFTVGGRET